MKSILSMLLSPDATSPQREPFSDTRYLPPVPVSFLEYDEMLAKVSKEIQDSLDVAETSLEVVDYLRSTKFTDAGQIEKYFERVQADHNIPSAFWLILKTAVIHKINLTPVQMVNQNVLKATKNYLDSHIKPLLQLYKTMKNASIHSMTDEEYEQKIQSLMKTFQEKLAKLLEAAKTLQQQKQVFHAEPTFVNFVTETAAFITTEKELKIIAEGFSLGLKIENMTNEGIEKIERQVNNNNNNNNTANPRAENFSEDEDVPDLIDESDLPDDKAVPLTSFGSSN